MRYLLPALSIVLLSACGGSDVVDDPLAEAEQAVAEAETRMAKPASEPIEMDGRVTLSVDRLIEESDPDNCLVMMGVRNGTDETVSAGLFSFEVEGDGQTGAANMFPQTTPSGEVRTAQVILPGRGCNVVERIVGGQAVCTLEDGTSCADDFELVDGEVDFSLND